MIGDYSGEIEKYFARNIDISFIKKEHFSVAESMYLFPYFVSPFEYKEDFFNLYVKPVIALGVIVNLFHTMSVEFSDRGLIEMISEGARTAVSDKQREVLSEYEQMLFNNIETMITKAPEHDYNVVNDDIAIYCRVGFSKKTKTGDYDL